MASEGSYTITLSNNLKEARALAYLCENESTFLIPSTEGRKKILDIINLPKKYSRAFDLIQVPGHVNNESEISVENEQHIRLIELKTTSKYLPELPKGFFFGATANEFDLAKKMGDRYAFCFVSLHPDSQNHCLLTLKELEPIIINKRIQYQINL